MINSEASDSYALRYKSLDDLEMLKSAADFLVEAMQGPCGGNQELAAIGQDNAVDAVKLMMSVRLNVGRAARGRHRVAEFKMVGIVLFPVLDFLIKKYTRRQ